MEFTQEEIQQTYNAAMDSVNLINGTKHSGMTDEEWADVIDRNKKHLEIVVSKDFWTTEDLTPFENAINA